MAWTNNNETKAGIGTARLARRRGTGKLKAALISILAYDETAQMDQDQ